MTLLFIWIEIKVTIIYINSFEIFSSFRKLLLYTLSAECAKSNSLSENILLSKKASHNVHWILAFESDNAESNMLYQDHSISPI